MEPGQVSRVVVPSSVCIPHPGIYLSDHLCEVLRTHDAHEAE